MPELPDNLMRAELAMLLKAIQGYRATYPVYVQRLGETIYAPTLAGALDQLHIPDYPCDEAAALYLCTSLARHYYPGHLIACREFDVPATELRFQVILIDSDLQPVLVLRHYALARALANLAYTLIQESP